MQSDVSTTFINSINDTTKHADFVEFSQRLVRSLCCCLRSQSTKVLKSDREAFCTHFHAFRNTTVFHDAWRDFLKKIGEEAQPPFYQLVTQNVVKILTEQLSQDPHTCTRASEVDLIDTPLSDVEQNALRYVGGYICMKIARSLTKSKSSNKEELLLFMSEACGLDPDSDEEESEIWTILRDRGGLYHINGITFSFFTEVEIELRHFFNIKKSVSKPQSKNAIVKHITECRNVLCASQVLTQDEEYNFGIDDLYIQFISEFVTLRGFYFAESIVESYKKISEKALQKSKGLRKTM